MPGTTDGWHDGFQYFMCERGKGMFVRLGALRRDDRFTDIKSHAAVARNRKFNIHSIATWFKNILV